MIDRAPLKSWFTPGLIGLHLLGLIAATLCTLGGFWQLGVYEARQGNAVDDAAASEAVPLADLWAAGEPFTTDLNHRLATVQGSFGPADEQFWVVGAETDERAWLVAPFEVSGSDAALLVVRGSTEKPRDLPPVPEAGQTITVSLQPSSSGGTALDDQRVTTMISVPTLLNDLSFRLWSGYGIVTDGAELPTGLTAIEPPDPNVSWTVGLKNLAYSLQWWVFAMFAGFMWWRMAREQVEGREFADQTRR